MFEKDNHIGTKHGVDYYKDSFGNIFCDMLDQSNMVGGGNELPRNEIENPIRLDRILSLNPSPKLLDYGCGHGMLVRYLKEHGVQAHGFDRYNPHYDNSPLFEAYDIVTLIEVIEHLSHPFSELDEIYKALKPGGILYVETSFSDWLTLADDYIDPRVGHCSIWSHSGLTAMMLSKGFEEGAHINRNVRIYRKP